MLVLLPSKIQSVIVIGCFLQRQQKKNSRPFHKGKLLRDISYLDGFLKERFNAEVAVYREDDAERYDPKHRAGMAMPYQPAIFIE